MSFPPLDGLFVYVCRHEWEGLELLLSGRMVWPQTQPLLHMYMYMYIHVPVRQLSGEPTVYIASSWC